MFILPLQAKELSENLKLRSDGYSEKARGNAGDNVKSDNSSAPGAGKLRVLALLVHKNLAQQMKHYLASLEREYILLPRQLQQY